MKCLQLCNDFVGSKVHPNLYTTLSEQVDQTVFFPIRSDQQYAKAKTLAESINVKIVCSKKMSMLHRLFFRRKISFLYRNIKTLTTVQQYDLTHATTLFSDGALAFKIYKDFGIPYIITVRGTDINLFLKYRKDLYTKAKEILTNAKYLIFISEAHCASFSPYLKKLNLSVDFKDKIKVIPNGIDDFWLNNKATKKNLVENQFKLVYIGKFNRNKNILRVIKAVKKVRTKIPNISLDLIGGGGNKEKEVSRLVNRLPFLTYHGKVFDKKKLKEYLANADAFIMVSKSETFGLVYIEALSQGIPIIYTKNEGIDGTFDLKVGSSANSHSVDSIANSILEVYQSYDTFSLSSIQFNRFNWNSIGNIYIKLYENALEYRSDNSSPILLS